MRADSGRFLATLGGLCGDADVPSSDADSSLRRRVHDPEKVVSLDGVMGLTLQSAA